MKVNEVPNRRIYVIPDIHRLSYPSVTNNVRPKHIVIVGYDDLTSLDLSGPLEAFSSAFLEDSRSNRQPCYKVTIAALGARTFKSVSGLRMTAGCFLSSLRHVDTLLIPGGRGIRLSPSAPKLADWISRRAKGIRRIASVCTGVFAIAPTGLLDGRRVTTHWKCRRIGPALSCVEGRRQCALHPGGLHEAARRAGAVFRAVEVSSCYH